MARARMVPKELFDPATELGKLYELLVTAHDGGPLAGILYIALWVRTSSKARFLAGTDDLAAAIGRIPRGLAAGPERIRGHVLAMERLGLVRLWSDGMALYGEVVHFFDHNTVRSDRESPCRIPDPPAPFGRAPAAVPVQRVETGSLFGPRTPAEIRSEYQHTASTGPVPDWRSVVPEAKPRGLRALGGKEDPT